MPSTLTWIDQDSAARDRSLRILSLFQEKESRDELGLGGIRDSIADQLFPGTSTIQTRLRYMLFVPWIYKDLEARGVEPGMFAQSADNAERSLIDTMQNMEVREKGVFGGRSGRELKRLPSSVYWAGLKAWGICKIRGSQDAYHRQIGRIYDRRKDLEAQRRERQRINDDVERGPEQGTETWHPKLPGPPAEFPRTASFQLTRAEAEFLLDRIKFSFPESLLAHLVWNCEPAKISAPWEHPDLASFTSEQRDLLEHGRIFAMVMRGATLIYNLALASLIGWKEKEDERKEDLRQWLDDELDLEEVRSWSVPQFWDRVRDQGHSITRQTQRFVEQWVTELTTHGSDVANHREVRELVQRREEFLKRGRSRFKNRRALEQWGGAAGLTRMTYRWPIVSTFLKDLHAGLQQEG